MERLRSSTLKEPFALRELLQLVENFSGDADSLAARFGLDQDAALDNIVFARAYTHEHQIQLITEIAAKMVEDHFRLLIVDSATALFR